MLFICLQAPSAGIEIGMPTASQIPFGKALFGGSDAVGDTSADDKAPSAGVSVDAPKVEAPAASASFALPEI